MIQLQLRYRQHASYVYYNKNANLICFFNSFDLNIVKFKSRIGKNSNNEIIMNKNKAIKRIYMEARKSRKVCKGFELPLH